MTVHLDWPTLLVFALFVLWLTASKLLALLKGLGEVTVDAVAWLSQLRSRIKEAWKTGIARPHRSVHRRHRARGRVVAFHSITPSRRRRV
jgi:hypothetical protein